MAKLTQLVVFSLDDKRYAISLDAIERIVRAAEVTRLPTAPTIVLGAVNVGGRVLPVLNLRLRFGLPEHDLRPSDHFLIARTKRRSVVLIVDEAQEVIDTPDAQIADASEIAPGIKQISGALKLASGLVLIHDLDTFLSLDEEGAVEKAMTEQFSDAI